MQKELVLFTALILVNLHGINGIPTANHSKDKNYDKGLNDEDTMIKPDEQNGDSATVRRSTSISTLHQPYKQHIYVAAKRLDETGKLTDEEKAATASEAFYPSFMRSSRQYFQPSESERFRATTAGRAKFTEQSLLGSGDFGVLKGGTFYQDNDPPLRADHNDFYGINLKSHNGHQRPFAAPLIQKNRYPSDFSDPFSNFRDFADINVSNDAGQYSEFHAVYANKDSSQSKPDLIKKKISASGKPVRNIKDQLDLIDKEMYSEHNLAKLSKSKLKLVKIKKTIDKKSKSKIPLDVTSTTSNLDSESDFMLALS